MEGYIVSWKCAACGEQSEPDFEVCWNCGTGRDGSLPAPEFLPDAKVAEIGARQLECLRCATQMRFGGRKRFHEGTRAWPFLFAEFGELFVNREAFDVYACPCCGKVELFIDPARTER